MFPTSIHLKYVDIVNMSPAPTPYPSTPSPLIPRIFMLQRKSIENRTNFDRELLGSQATYDIDFILFGILTTISFHRVLKHSWGWSMSRAIRVQSWSDFPKKI